MRIGRTLPPAAAPIPLGGILRAFLASLVAANRDDRWFEEEIQRDFGTRYCFAVSSGKAGLTLILKALKELYPGRDEVLVPAFTCYSVPAAIKKAGLRVALCDLAPSSLDLDLGQLREKIVADREKKTVLCVLVTHLFGCPAALPEIRKITGAEVPIIEDAAQAMGEESNGKRLGVAGDAGFFSLGRGKALSTMEGGLVLTSRDDLGQAIARLVDALPRYSKGAVLRLAAKALLTNVLQGPWFFWLPKALPFLRLGETIYEEDFPVYRISALQRELARNWGERLERHRRARKALISFWRGRLPDRYTLLCCSTDTSMIRLPILAQTGRERDCLCRQSERLGLGIMPAYPAPIHELPELQGECAGQCFPHARDICDRLFTIPVHELVTPDDNRKIEHLLSGGQDTG